MGFQKLQSVTAGKITVAARLQHSMYFIHQFARIPHMLVDMIADHDVKRFAGEWEGFAGSGSEQRRLVGDTMQLCVCYGVGINVDTNDEL